VTAYLAVCAIYRDEARYLREWIEFHRLVGAERFYLYANRCEDDHERVLAPYVAAGIVEMTDWPRHPGQISAYDNALRRFRNDARWIAFIDADEFLFSPTLRTLPEVLREYERWPGVAVNQAMFGTSGHVTPPSGLVIESYTRRTEDPRFNAITKCVVDPRRVRAFCKPTFFKYWEGETVDENHRPVGGPPWGLTGDVSFDVLRINHYTTRSEQEYRNKAVRGWTDGVPVDEKIWQAENIARRLRRFDEVRDETILAYLPRLRHNLGHG
jgi:hypothetical protein